MQRRSLYRRHCIKHGISARTQSSHSCNPHRAIHNSRIFSRIFLSMLSAIPHYRLASLDSTTVFQWSTTINRAIDSRKISSSSWHTADRKYIRMRIERYAGRQPSVVQACIDGHQIYTADDDGWNAEVCRAGPYSISRESLNSMTPPACVYMATQSYHLQ